jgi:hypothetical protein
MIYNNKETIKILRERFSNSDPFTYVRFGDADLYFMDDPQFKLNRRHDPSPNLSLGIRKAFTITDQDYLIGCVAGTDLFRDSQKKLIQIASAHGQERDYYSPVALHKLYRNTKRFTEFVSEVFQDKKILLIGGESICQSDLVLKVFNVSESIALSDRNAFYKLDSSMKDIEEKIPKYDIVISALGQGTRVLAGRLWRKKIKTQYFDVGSVVDALAERPLRTWIEAHSFLVEDYKKIFL